jgi:hypothetical protein
MKTIIAKAKGIAMPVTMLLITAIIFFSCQKNAESTTAANANTAAPADNMSAIANMVNGETLEGSMIAATDEDNNLSLVFNKGSKFIIVQKIPGMPFENPDEIKQAVVITSKYGIIIKNTKDNKAWLMINNDDESLQKFEAVKLQLHCSLVTTTIFGTTIVNAQS